MQRYASNYTPNYKFGCQLGSGSFGTVFKAFNLETLKTVAIKRTLKSGALVSREFSILTEVSQCENCIRLLEIFYTITDSGSCIQHLVFEYYPENLSRYLRYRFKSLNPLSYKEIIVIFRQILLGLRYIHSKGIMHRDLKPENIMIDPKDLSVKICDFGSAKKLKNDKNTSYIVSRYYRAPELIFCNTNYTTSIDIWAAGCIFIELFNGVPAFTGRDEGDQFIKQATALGPPTVDDLNKLARNCKVSGKAMLKALSIKKTGNFIENFKNCPEPSIAADLAKKMLTFDPQIRPSAAECLDHHFFTIA